MIRNSHARALAVAAIIAGVLAAVGTRTALADPPRGTEPRPADVVGVGTPTDQYLFDQLALDYDLTHRGASTLLYSWDAASPTAKNNQIRTKAGCAAITRPDNSASATSALEDKTKDPAAPADYCIDFARAVLSPDALGTSCKAGGYCLVTIARDAVTWVARSAARGGTDAPRSLTPAQLAGIFECKYTNWRQVGGKNAHIRAFLPQTSSDMRAVWLAALGHGKPITPGRCVSDDHNKLIENEAVNPVLDSAEAIYIYSIGTYIAQAYHSAQCASPACAAVMSPLDTATKCHDPNGCEVLEPINGTRPDYTTCEDCWFQNINFLASFLIPVSVVVGDPGGPTGRSESLDPFFSPSGWICTSPMARQAFLDNGLLLDAPGFQCGTVRS